MTKVLTILPEKYKYFISAWESTPTSEKTIENLMARLLIEEARNRAAHEEEPVAFKAIEKRCFRCNSTKHLSHAYKNNSLTAKDKSKELK